MTAGRRARREPRFDVMPTRADVRVSARDRAGGGADPSRRARSPRGQDEAPVRRKRGRSGSGGGRSPLGRVIYWGLVLGLWAVIAAIGAIAWIGAHLPAVQTLEIPKRPPSIQITGNDGRVLATRGEMVGADIPLKEMPAHLPRALIAVEDRRFFSHSGVDPLGMGRAFLANLINRGVSQGGSTITQQLAKNLFLTQERTIHRKLQELILALWIEHKYSKNQILELYLNRVYFGAGAYGVEAAAQRYFRKSARHVTLAEAAMLAGLVKSPSRLAPSRNPDGAERRAQIVLSAMAEMRFITEGMAKAALANPARVVRHAGAGSVNYIADWVMDVLDDLVGSVEQDVTVETSIDPMLQAAAEKALVEELAQKGERLSVGQGALVAMSPDGRVRALVGGRNYTESQYNRAVAARRQPGSAFKPFIYLTALERGLTPESVREDRPIDVKGWRPENYSRQYFGPVTLKQALAHSLNTVSVRLTLEFGPPAVVRTAHRLGIASKLSPNASIALGTSEVSLIELVSAFAPFANGGVAINPHVVESVRTAKGKTLYARKPQKLGRIIDPSYVAMMNAMMRETLLTGTARRADLTGWPAAGKTGTSQDFRDAWFVGYTGHLVTGIWLGNDDSSPTRKATGGGLPVEIWNRFMKSAHQNAAVVGLPGLSTHSAFGFPLPQLPIPSAPHPERQAPDARPGLDNWLLERLFGRR